MDSNSPLTPLQGSTPVVPNVPQVPKVPDVPEIPKTPAAEPPKITGVSMPVGTNKKPESPTQRSNKINAANAPKPVTVVPEQKLLHRPVTAEEVEAYRKKISKRKRRIAFSILIFLILAGITTATTLIIKNRQRYLELSTIYNDNLPIVIYNSASENVILLSQNGEKISDKYSDISAFESDRSLATTTQGETTNYAIISNSGEEIFTTTDILRKINSGQNYILSNSTGSYLLDKDGKTIDDRKLITTNFNEIQEYFLVANDNNYAIIDAKGQEKISGVLDKSEVTSFSYAQNAYEDNYYCALIINRKNDSRLYVYNCESGKEITNIEDVYYMGGFEKSSSSFLTSEKGSSYFYNNEMIYNSETQDTEYIGGIIKQSSDGKFFNPVTRKTTESFPTDNLINQDELDEKTTVTEECSAYENHPESKLVNICSNIYYNNKLVATSTSNLEYSLADKKLDDFLSYHKKYYFNRENKSNQKLSIMDAEIGNEAYNSILNENMNMNDQDFASRFIVRLNNQKKIVIDLATGESAEYEAAVNISLGANYYVVSSEDGVRYYNAKHKEIYKEEY